MGEEESSGKRVSKWDEMPNLENLSRKEKRKCLKKMKRKMLRKEAAEKEKALEESLLNDPQYQLGLCLQEQQEAEASEKARQDYEEREKTWLLNYQNAILQHEHEEQQKQKSRQTEEDKKPDQEEGDWEYVEDGPAEIIWQGNEIIVKKNKIKVPKQKAEEKTQEDLERPFSNPLPPQHDAFAEHKMHLHSSVGETVFNEMEQQIPNFGTEQDKAHCPFHIKTGACRFGDGCSRTHFSPDKSCTLLMRNMYNGPGLSWEQDEGLEYTEEEVDSHYLEFYEDVHTEFLKFGQLVNFKVCRNSSAHLRGNVYVHYRSLESAISARNAQNGRHFAGKMVTCEFVGVTRWKVAICGEYKKTGHKTCSRGSACNFLHCFHNPGGEYDWADWDRDPPRSWQEQMRVLFGGSRDGHHVERNIKEHGLNRDRYNDRYSRSIRNKTSSGNNNFKEKESRYGGELKQRQKCFHDGYRSSSDDEGCWTPNIDTYCDARVRHHHRERSSTEHSMDRYRHRDRRDKLSYKKGKLKEYDSWSRDERKQKQKDFLDSRSVSDDEENLKLDIDMLLAGSGAYHGGEQSHRENDKSRYRQRSRSQGKESSVEDNLEEKGFSCINERRRRKVLSDGKRTNSADETDLLLDMDKADLKWLKPNKKESSYGKGYQEKSRILEVDISGGDREAKTLFDPSGDTDVHISKKWHQSGNACTESYVSKNNSDYDSKADEYTLKVGDTYVLEDTQKSSHHFGIEISRESKKRSEVMKNSDNKKSYKENQCHETSAGKQSSRYDERHNLNNNEHFGGDKCSPSSHGKYMDRKRSLPKSTSESVSRKRRKNTSSRSKRTPEEVPVDCFDRWQASD